MEESPPHLCLDKGYDNEPTRDVLKERGYIEHIRRIGEEKKAEQGEKPLPSRRWVGERTFLRSRISKNLSQNRFRVCRAMLFAIATSKRSSFTSTIDAQEYISLGHYSSSPQRFNECARHTCVRLATARVRSLPIPCRRADFEASFHSRIRDPSSILAPKVADRSRRFFFKAG